MDGKTERVGKNLATGYYINESLKLENVKNRRVDDISLEYFEDGVNPYDYADVFLHGSCHLFAIMLQKKYGYSIINLQTESNENAHFFCKSNRKGRDVYIDVRGITTNLNEVIFPFIHVCEKYELVPYDLDDKETFSEADHHGLRFAEQLIEDNPEFYDINEL